MSSMYILKLLNNKMKALINIKPKDNELKLNEIYANDGVTIKKNSFQKYIPMQLCIGIR